MKYFKYPVNEDQWVVYLVDEENMASIFKDEDNEGDAHAFVDPDKKEMYFEEGALNLAIVRHEMTHVIFHYFFISDTHMDQGNVEEVVAAFLEHRLDWFKNKCDDLYSKLMELKHTGGTDEEEGE